MVSSRCLFHHFGSLISLLEVVLLLCPPPTGIATSHTRKYRSPPKKPPLCFFQKLYHEIIEEFSSILWNMVTSIFLRLWHTFWNWLFYNLQFPFMEINVNLLPEAGLYIFWNYSFTSHERSWLVISWQLQHTPWKCHNLTCKLQFTTMNDTSYFFQQIHHKNLKAFLAIPLRS